MEVEEAEEEADGAALALEPPSALGTRQAADAPQKRQDADAYDAAAADDDAVADPAAAAAFPQMRIDPSISALRLINASRSGPSAIP